ncbi:MAG: LapA family protein [Sphingomonas sp.]|nr:LapA family protein [Sphingomonas sp.]
MKFLKTLLWVVIAALVAILAAHNWRDVTINLWGDLQADIKIPLLLLVMVLIGFLPAWLVYRARYWRMVRRTPAAPVTTRVIEADREGAPE